MRGSETVGAHVVASVPRAALQSTAAQARARLAAEKPDCMDLVLVTDAEGRLAGELRTGMMLGAALGLICVLPIWWALGDLRLAAAVAAAVFSAGTVASAIGLLLPWVLARHAVDPAYGSGPVATVIQDVISLLVYFAVVQAVGL